MKEIIGIKFKKPGKIYFFDPKGEKLKKGDFVIVETVNGMEIAEVTIENKEMPEEKIINPLKSIIRKATYKDIKHKEENNKQEEEALKKAQRLAQKHNLDMNLMEAEYTFDILDASYTLDKKQLLFNFIADERVDFRELAKRLAQIYKTRIELRQVGVRDQVRKIGGNGVCGRELCCCSFLDNFDSVSIKMAKEQNIALTPSKISGSCGRLMCCLRYEQNVYEEKLARLPKVGATVKAPEEGIGIVDSIETLKERIRVKFTDKEGLSYFKRYDAKDVKVIKDVDSKNEDTEIEDEELKKLEEE